MSRKTVRTKKIFGETISFENKAGNVVKLKKILRGTSIRKEKMAVVLINFKKFLKNSIEFRK